MCGGRYVPISMSHAISGEFRTSSSGPASWRVCLAYLHHHLGVAGRAAYITLKNMLTG